MPLLPTLGPLGKLQSCGLGIPGCWTQLEHRLRDIERQSKAVGMILNTDKTKVICFNFTKNRQAEPFIGALDGAPVQVVDNMRLLGIPFDHKLSWWDLVDDICSRVRKKLWMLLRFREAGANQCQILTAYLVRIRPVIEYGAAVYGAVLSGVQAREIENLQMHSLQLVLGSQSQSYAKNRIKLLPVLSWLHL